MGFNNSWFGGVSSYADAVKKAANLQDLNSVSDARENLSVYSKAAVDGKISDLAASKSDVGTFNFGTSGGALQTTGNPMYGIVDRSYCMTLELDEDWNLNDTTALWLNLGSDGIRSSSLAYGGVWCQLRSRSNTNVLQITYGDGQNTYLNAFGNVVNVENIFGGSDNSIIPAGKYVLCICIHFGAGTSADPSKAYIYVNDALKATISGYGTTKSENLNWVSGGKVGFFDIADNHSTSSFSSFGHFEGKASRFVIFNFDVSAAGAPYSVDDYYNGKAIPVSLQSSTAEKRCILAAADYSFGGKVRDISGNENHLTVYGDVKGDKDEAIKQMYNAFSAAYTAENATA